MQYVQIEYKSKSKLVLYQRMDTSNEDTLNGGQNCRALGHSCTRQYFSEYTFSMGLVDFQRTIYFKYDIAHMSDMTIMSIV